MVSFLSLLIRLPVSLAFENGIVSSMNLTTFIQFKTIQLIRKTFNAMCHLFCHFDSSIEDSYILTLSILSKFLLILILEL